MKNDSLYILLNPEDKNFSEDKYVDAYNYVITNDPIFPFLKQRFVSNHGFPFPRLHLVSKDKERAQTYANVLGKHFSSIEEKEIKFEVKKLSRKGIFRNNVLQDADRLINLFKYKNSITLDAEYKDITDFLGITDKASERKQF